MSFFNDIITFHYKCKTKQLKMAVGSKTIITNTYSFLNLSILYFRFIIPRTFPHPIIFHATNKDTPRTKRYIKKINSPTCLHENIIIFLSFGNGFYHSFLLDHYRNFFTLLQHLRFGYNVRQQFCNAK